MPLTEKGEKIRSALEKEYGKKKGEEVLYAGKNKGTFTGIDSDKMRQAEDAIHALDVACDEMAKRCDAAETERGKENARGKFGKELKEEIGRVGGPKREDDPESAFLVPSEKKYPVKTKEDGEWKYNRKLLLAAAREARMHGKENIAKKADEIREREFK